MRVLLVSPYYYPAVSFGGPVWAIRDQVRGLKEAGVPVEVLTTSANLPRNDRPRQDSVDGTPVHYHQRLTPASWYFSPALATSLRQRAGRDDLVHIHGLWTFPSLAASLAARSWELPYLLTPHGCLEAWALSYRGWKKQLYLALVERRNLHRSAAVHCLTAQEAEEVRCQAPRARPAIIPNPVTVDPQTVTDAAVAGALAKYPQLRDKLLVLFLARLHPKKGLDVLVPAFAEVSKRFPKAHLVVAGPDEASYRTEVLRLVERLQVPAEVTLTGLVAGQEKLALLKLCDVFTLPSYSEGLPVSVLEALAFGKPVVISSKCNLTAEMRTYAAGIVVEPDARQLAEGLGTLLGSADRRRHMGGNGMRLAREKFSLQRTTRMLVEVYEDVLSKRVLRH